MNRALVTGGGGFLGLAVCRMLKERGDDVFALNRNHYAALDDLRVHQFTGDISDPAVVLNAAKDCDIVFHVAAKAGVWGSLKSYHQANVEGTRNVLDACRKHGIRRLVYTSSPSVVFNGQDQVGIDESEPYPDSYLAWYPETKAEAERMVITANSPELATVSLRPHLIWGPGDNHLVPRLIARARAGKLRLVGAPDKLVDSVYIDNAAKAHLQAADCLENSGACAGKNYFITNDEPMPMADLVNGILAAAGLPPVTRQISANTAYRAGWLMEKAYGLFGINEEPRVTRFVARQLATAHWFKIDAAKQDLGYSADISIKEGLSRLKASLNQA